MNIRNDAYMLATNYYRAWGVSLMRTATCSLVLAVTAAAAPLSGRGILACQVASMQGVGVLIGVVRDTLGRPLGSAEVYLAALRRRASTSAEGLFRFENVKPGDYDVAARRLGFYPQVRSVAVGANGATLSFELLPLPTTLQPILTVADPPVGLSGRVSDTSEASIQDAQVVAVAAGRTTVTDSAGEFFLALKPGQHMIRVSRMGFREQLLSFPLPKNQGRRVQIWLASPAGRSGSHSATTFAELRERLTRKSAARSALFTQDDIERRGWKELSHIATVGAERPVDPGCPALVDGGPRTEMIWALRASELMAVEVYRADVQVFRAGEVDPLRVREAMARTSPGCPDLVIAWLKR